MDYEHHSVRPRQVGLWRIFKYLFAMSSGGIVLLSLVGLFGFWRTGGHLLSSIGRIFDLTQPAATVDMKSIVVQQIRGASDLTTAVFTMEAVVPTQQDREIGGLVVGRTRLLYIARGEVRAGVALSDLRDEDITLIGDRIQIRLPPPRILDSKIDVQRSTVYDYDRGFLALGPDVGTQLQTMAEQQSLDKITEAACIEGLLHEANQRASDLVSRLLNLAGYQNVLVTTQPPSPTACADFKAGQASAPAHP
ncbi:hypothetical protein BST81_20605 [Leptolyngbya sp. 'hensonii']|uniref:DUF4230 domain-containing protein n=1 Tax=Leptolyngbya sp. 'hensonii' TaxID=1922337 RepID=UPI0009501D11|nr:DUF4230 domain-containing protein [Leptolyngbya sp. 'hensonii']OLP16600.1 hypothetical protein BST81_20605 [Leptolyngbya sp. 'hensonii']